MFYFMRGFCSFFIITVFFISSGWALEESGAYYFPEPRDNYVNDFAEMISEEDEQEIRALLAQLESETGIEMGVVTVERFPTLGNSKTQSFEIYATRLFNQWGVGHAGENTGIMILVAKQANMVRIELGKGFHGDAVYLNNEMQAIIQSVMIPRFKEDNPTQAIANGVKAVIQTMTVQPSWLEQYQWEILIGLLVIVSLFFHSYAKRSGRQGAFWFCLGFAGVLWGAFSASSNPSSSQESDGFGGGDSLGDGATGSWGSDGDGGSDGGGE